MPKPAVTLFGLMLAAFSIGWNTWRYPVVWQMANPPTTAISAGELAPVATEKTSSPAVKKKRAKPSPPAAIAPAKPVPEATKKVIPDRSPVNDSSAAARKQMRPIMPPSAGGEMATVQRLPLVDPNEPLPAMDLRTADGSAILYPSTGY